MQKVKSSLGATLGVPRRADGLTFNYLLISLSQSTLV